MRRLVLPILAGREAVSFSHYHEPSTPHEQGRRRRRHHQHEEGPHNALGWPVFDREGRLVAVAVAVNHIDDRREEAEGGEDGDDDARADRAAGVMGRVGASGGRYAAFGAEEERTMVNLCSQVR